MSDFLTNGSRVDKLYGIDKLLQRNNMDKDAFYHILKLLDVTDRKIEYKLFNLLLSTPQELIEDFAQTIVKVKNASNNVQDIP
jgi:hypothetical protein